MKKKTNSKCDLPFACILCSFILTLCLTAGLGAAAPLKPVKQESTIEETQTMEPEIENFHTLTISEAQILPPPKLVKRVKQADTPETTQAETIEVQQEEIKKEEFQEELSEETELTETAPEEFEEPVVEPLTALGEFVITYYCSCVECCGIWATNRPVENGKEVVYTASGERAYPGLTVAVDPSWIPYGTTLYIEGLGYRIAQDCGGGIKGNRIDVYMESHEAACASGMHTAEVYVVN